MALARERGTWIRSGSRTSRGSGDHHNRGWSSSNHGKIPLAYARSRRSGDRSPPTASTPEGWASDGSGKTSSLRSRKIGTRAAQDTRGPAGPDAGSGGTNTFRHPRPLDAVERPGACRRQPPRAGARTREGTAAPARRRTVMNESGEYSRGGSRLLRYDAPEDRAPDFAVGDSAQIEAIQRHFEAWIGPVEMTYHEIVSDLVHVDVH